MTKSPHRQLVRHRKLRVCLKDLGRLLAVWAAAYIAVHAFGWESKEMGNLTLSSCLSLLFLCTALVAAVVWFIDGVLPRMEKSGQAPVIHTHIHQTHINNYGGSIHQLNTGHDASLAYRQTTSDK